MLRNHTNEERGKAQMIINYKKLNDNTIFDCYYIPNKAVLFNRIKGSLGSRKWIAKVDIGK